MPSISRKQAAYFEMLYNNKDLAKQHGVDYNTVKEFVEADRANGTKNLPERKGKKTVRSKKRK